MSNIGRSFVLTLTIAFALSGCGKKEEPIKQKQQVPANDLRASTPQPTTEKSLPAPQSISTEAPGFDINKVPVANPQLGSFPYFGLIKDYQPTLKRPNYNKDVAFDRYEFFDGTKIIPVEGRLTTIEAEGRGASAFEVLKTYEKLITGLGGVKVYEGDLRLIVHHKLEFSDERHRDAVFDEDRVGVYMLRMPDKEIWVEAFVSSFRNKEGYFLTVVEKKALEVRAAIIPAAEMKRELDAKGHVALYINFDFDKADIKPESRPIVDEVVKLLTDNVGLSLTIEGHTDNVGAPDYNARLSDARAKSVVAALTAQGIVAQRLRAVGYGQDRPIADNDTDAGRAKNRRVELVRI